MPILPAMILFAVASDPKPPTAIDPTEWLAAVDYPAAAIRAAEEGRVAFRVTVNLAGRASDCVVTASSGSVALDASTCIVVMQQARFHPATDDRGHASVASYSGSVLWQIPKPEPRPFADWTSHVRLALDQKGAVVSCDSHRVGPVVDDASTSCDDVATAPAEVIQVLAPGEGAREVFVQTAFRTDKTTMPISPPAGFSITSSASAAVRIAADGSVTECRKGPATGVAVILPDICVSSRQDRFVSSEDKMRAGAQSMTIATRPR